MQKIITFFQKLFTSDFPLHDAVQEGDNSKVKELLNQNINPNTQDKNGKTALWLAVAQQKVEIVKVLAAVEGINPNLRARAPEDDSPLHLAVRAKNLEMVKTLFSIKGINPNGDNTSLKNTPLMEAISEKCDEEMIEFLLENGASPSVCIANQSPATPLKLAVQCNALNIVELLLKKGADCNDNIEWQGKTALHYAINNRALKDTDRSANTEIIKLLLKYDAKPTVPNKSGRTPLDYAEEQCDQAIIDLLKEAVPVDPEDKGKFAAKV